MLYASSTALPNDPLILMESNQDMHHQTTAEDIHQKRLLIEVMTPSTVRQDPSDAL